jgi:mannose-6-phosphate isomerase-like protein (cupin superfamily)
MFSFFAKHPPRTRVAHLAKVHYDEGRSWVEFKGPNDEYFVINEFPPAASDAEVRNGIVSSKANCALAPALHWHRDQDERFRVLHGTAKFTLDGKDILASQGEVVSIPKKAFHTFCNASETEKMRIEFVLQPTRRERDLEFFSKYLDFDTSCALSSMTERFRKPSNI